VITSPTRISWRERLSSKRVAKLSGESVVEVRAVEAVVIVKIPGL
jgi:hypothetical protein